MRHSSSRYLSSPYIIPMLCCALFVVCQVLPGNYQQLLPLNRVAVGHNEWWRIFSGHFIHLDWQHLLLNGLVLIIFQGLYRGYFNWRHWLVWLPLLCIGVSFGLLWLSPGIDWYVGFSGVLTGLLVAAAIQQWRQMPLINAVILAAITIKIFFEQLSGKAVVISSISHIPTVIDAHLYGAACAAILATLGIMLRR